MRLRRPIILFADDDPIARTIAQKVADNLGVSTVLASNGD